MSMSQSPIEKKPLSLFGGALIIAGTSIGGGMLGLPVVTGQAGFFPSLLVLVLSWAFMMITGFLYLELCVLYKQQVNILTMATRSFGKFGRISTWIMYLFLFYCLTIAYMVGGANFLENSIPGSQAIRTLLFSTAVIGCILFGKSLVDWTNRGLMFGLLISYLGFVVLGVQFIQSSLLFEQSWSEAFVTLPIVFASFGYQGTLPTIARWMHYDKKRVKQAVMLGTFSTLVIYVIWQWLFLGIVPKEGTHGLLETMQEGRDAIYPLQFVLQHDLIYTLANIFGFCALTTSFLGVGIGLVDFIADGLRITTRSGWALFILGMGAFFVPLFFALLYPNVFLEMLSLAGGFGGAFLLAGLPIAMVFKERFYAKVPICEGSLLGKKSVLFFLFGAVLFEVGCEIFRISSNYR